MNQKNLTYYKKIARYLTGEMTVEQQQNYKKQMKRNHYLKKDVNLIKQSWQVFSFDPSDKYTETEGAWSRLKNRLDEDGILQDSSKYQIINLRYALRVAAIALIVVSIGIPTVYFSYKEITSKSDYIEQSAIESTHTVDLPDGSRVFLNQGAKLRYKNTFEENRNVTLEGEGYFDVMANPAKPFHVNTGKVIITVLGTSFNVKAAHAQNEQTEVYVESGSVEVAMVDSKESIVIESGQLVRAEEKLNPDLQTDLNYLSWKTKEFRFIDEPVTEIIDVLKKAYHVEVNDSAIENFDMRLTTTYKGQTFDAVLNTICTALNIQYKKEGKVYILQKK